MIDLKKNLSEQQLEQWACSPDQDPNCRGFEGEVEQYFRGMLCRTQAMIIIIFINYYYLLQQ